MATMVKSSVPDAVLRQTGFSAELVKALSARKQEPSWVQTFRQENWALYEETPLPDWRRTPLDGLDLNTFLPFGEAPVEPPPETIAQATDGEKHAAHFVQRNSVGRVLSVDPDLQAQGVIVTDLETAVREHADLVREFFMTKCVPPTEDKFTALHAAAWTGGLFIYVPRNVQIELPIQGTFWIDQPGLSVFPHTLIILEEGASLTYIEENTSPTLERPNLVSGVAEVYLGRGSQVRYVVFQNWGENTYNFTHYRALAADDSFINWTFGAVGGGLSRTTMESRLEGNGSSTELLGAYLLGGKQRLEIDTVMNHIARFTGGDLLFKGVLKDEAYSVFQGLIKIHPGAQDTNSYLSDQTLLLSDDAQAESIPSLEIEANEVRASHGATVSPIDEEQIFYLQTRGLTKTQAVRMIIEGFFQPVMERIPFEGVRAKLQAAIEQKMQTGLPE